MRSRGARWRTLNVLAYLITRWIFSAGRCRGNDSDSGLLSSSFNCPWVFIVRAYTRRDIVLTRLSCTSAEEGREPQEKFNGNAEVAVSIRPCRFRPSSRPRFRFLPLRFFFARASSLYPDGDVRSVRPISSKRVARIYGGALFSNITSTTGSEGRGERERETPSDHARLNFRVRGKWGLSRGRATDTREEGR